MKFVLGKDVVDSTAFGIIKKKGTRRRYFYKQSRKDLWRTYSREELSEYKQLKGVIRVGCDYDSDYMD